MNCRTLIIAEKCLQGGGEVRAFCFNELIRNTLRPSYYYWGDIVVLESVGLSLSVENIYERVRNEDVGRLLDGA
jgi:hypothetical protein